MRAARNVGLCRTSLLAVHPVLSKATAWAGLTLDESPHDVGYVNEPEIALAVWVNHGCR